MLDRPSGRGCDIARFPRLPKPSPADGEQRAYFPVSLASPKPLHPQLYSTGAPSVACLLKTRYRPLRVPPNNASAILPEHSRPARVPSSSSGKRQTAAHLTADSALAEQRGEPAERSYPVGSVARFQQIVDCAIGQALLVLSVAVIDKLITVKTGEAFGVENDKSHASLARSA